jgi:hypothetical protein
MLPAIMLALTACDPGWNDFELRVAWRPDSAVAGSDSCLQRFYMKGNKLGSRLWCTPEGETFLKSENDLEIILARHEWREISTAALQVEVRNISVPANLSSIPEGQALVWVTQGNVRSGFLTTPQVDPSADSLITIIRRILANRRPRTHS